MAKDHQPVKLTKSLMNQYRDALVSRGCKQQTISMYFCYLNRLYAFLPGEKELTTELLKQWIEQLQKEGYSDRTINLHLSSINGLLRYCGQSNISVSVIRVSRNAGLSELTRDEYLQVLTYAKENCCERDYLLFKTLATIDINVVDLGFLTVEACRNGVAEVSNNREILIPDSLQKELIEYIDEQEIKEGPVFVSKYGQLLDRSNITHMIRRLGGEAGIDSRKCTPRTLHRLYQQTQEEIDQQLISLHKQAYEDLLYAEESKVG